MWDYRTLTCRHASFIDFRLFSMALSSDSTSFLEASTIALRWKVESPFPPHFLDHPVPYITTTTQI
jgi:hypothetical protein